MKLEEYRQGYPRLSAFLVLDENFTVVKRFDYLHMRSLLGLQDELAELEEKLRRCDKDEDVQLHLSSRRQDLNSERKMLLESIRLKLEAYDKAILEYRGLIELPKANARDLQSVHNWVDGTKPLVRSESACFLNINKSEDHIALGVSRADQAGIGWMFRVLVQVSRRASIDVFSGGVSDWLEIAAKVQSIDDKQRKTGDGHIILLPSRMLDITSRVVVAIVTPAWLVLPAILLYQASSPMSRIWIYAWLTFGSSLGITAMVNTNKYNQILALITYGAVITAFMSGSLPSLPEKQD